jgi:GNAT superfamily N-acetyltransferase
MIMASRAERLRVPTTVLRETFAELRRCGAGHHECQVLWTGPWSDPHIVAALVHPSHRANGVGFELDSSWLTTFWQELTRTGYGVRVQIHTHPGRAFHSEMDDAWPLIHTPGFFSLVIPEFATGEVGFAGAYLTEIGEDGQWHEVHLPDHLEITT